MSRHVWMASAFAATWHKVDVRAGGPAPAAACGHRLRAPVHRRLTGPLPDDGRIPCDACAAVLAAFRGAGELRTPRSVTGYFSGRLPLGGEEVDRSDDEGGDSWNLPGRNGRPDNSAPRHRSPLAA